MGVARRRAQTSSTALLPLLLPCCCLSLLAVLTLYAYRHILVRHPSSPLGLDDADADGGEASPPAYYPEWDYLWDDDKNYYENDRILAGLSWDALRWAWTSPDAVIWGVREPVALTVKLALHSLPIEFDARTYRVINLWGHFINVWLVFLVGRSVVTIACDAAFLEGTAERELKALEEEEGRPEGSPSSAGLGGGGGDGGVAVSDDAAAAEAPGGGARRRRGRKRGTEHDTGRYRYPPRAARGAQSNDDDDGRGIDKEQPAATTKHERRWESLRARRRYLARHDNCTTLGSCLGAAVFAVHPLQVHTIGWASCMSYVFATFFGLLSVWCWVRHRDEVRDEERSREERRGVVLYDGVSVSVSSSSKSTRRGTKKRGAGAGAKRAPAPEHRDGGAGDAGIPLWLGLSAVLYVLAALCKAPAITLPLVLVIMDVFLYSDLAPRMRNGANEEKQGARGGGVGKIRRTSRPKSIGDDSSAMPRRKIMVRRPLPSLVSALARSTAGVLPSHLPHLLCVPFLLNVHLTGNEGGESASRIAVSLADRIVRALWALGWYATKAVYPVDLAAAVHHETWYDRWEVWTAAVLVPCLTLAVLAWSVRVGGGGGTAGRVAACGWGSAVALLLPSLGIIRHSRLLVADRYMYMPLAMAAPILGAIAGACYTLSASNAEGVDTLGGDAAFATHCGLVLDCVSRPDGTSPDVSSPAAAPSRGQNRSTDCGDGDAQRRRRARGTNRRVLIVLAGVVAATTCGVAFFAARSTPRALRHWRNDELLWTRSVAMYPAFESAHTNLVRVYNRRGDYGRALLHAGQAVKIRPDVTKYWFNYSQVLTAQGLWGEAAEFLRPRVEIIPNSDHYAKTLHYHMGLSLYWMGEWEDAEKELALAVSLGSADGKKPLDALRKLKIIPGKEENRREKWLQENGKAST